MLPRRVRRLEYLALGFLCSLVPALASASHSRVTQASIDNWLHSSPRITLTHGHLFSQDPAMVATVKDLGVSGFVGRPQDAIDGQLASGQEVMVLPLPSGGSGGIFYALMFTRTHGVVTFVGALHSNGHLFTYLAHGTLHVVGPKYAIGDAQCCPSSHIYRILTLRGTHIVVLKHWIAPSLIRSR